MSQSDVTENGRSRSGAPRWLWAVLLASLMINMVVVGVFAGRMWAHHGHGGYRHEGGVQGFLKGLPEARQQELGALVKANREGLRAERTRIRALKQAVREAITREPFDRAALEAALTEVSVARQGLRARAASDLADLVARMTPQERQLFAERGLSRRGRHRDRDM